LAGGLCLLGLLGSALLLLAFYPSLLLLVPQLFLALPFLLFLQLLALSLLLFG
jgi:hypothetical protein